MEWLIIKYDRIAQQEAEADWEANCKDIDAHYAAQQTAKQEQENAQHSR